MVFENVHWGMMEALLSDKETMKGGIMIFSESPGPYKAFCVPDIFK